jgi:signal transduction histidine kinase
MTSQEQRRGREAEQKVAFRMHPRVFAALGADLVTNDVVAVIELVKNAYDALATRVDVRFREGKDLGAFLEIEDNGIGMTDSMIDDVWCVVATPYRHSNPTTTKGRMRRRASGEKGLGRLSAARLGDRIEMLTQSEGKPCWKVTVDWSVLASAEKLEACFAVREKYAEPSPFSSSGTILRIHGLKEWDTTKVDDLKDNLSRLVSPFSKIENFAIFFTPPGEEAAPVAIEPPRFLSYPPYLIRGELTEDGDLSCRYTYAPLQGKKRNAERKFHWAALREELHSEQWAHLKKPSSGPFKFEVRAWDIGGDDMAEVAGRFKLQKTTIRKSIKAFKGISVYRDGILVLPKTESARDWLGLDLRRVSRTGTRLSTSQIVGYTAITAENNPEIADTSDRERLVNRPEVVLFEELLKYIVAVLETERESDRREARLAEEPLSELFTALSPAKLVADITEIAKEGGTVSETMPLIADFGRRLEEAKDQIERRFVYYSRLATVGTIAQMLVHEVGNKTMVIGKFLTSIKQALTSGELKGDILQHQLDLAESALDSLSQLADRFSPLASRSFRRGRRDCVLEKVICECLDIKAAFMERMGIQARRPDSVTRVAVDPGELFAVVFNLLDNALYWLAQSESKDRRVRFAIRDGRSRVNVEIHDSGPGITEGDEEKIFLPGVTRKPNGIGMGLTVASELVAEYGGRMHLIHPGNLGGASFGFDLPKSST